VEEKNETKAFFELFDAFVEERGKQNDWTKAYLHKTHAVGDHYLF